MSDAVEWRRRAQAARDAGDREGALAGYIEAMAAAHEAGDFSAQMHDGRHAADLHRELGNFDEAHVLIGVTLWFYREHAPSDLELANTLRVAALVESAYADDGRRFALWNEAGELYARVRIHAGVEECERQKAACSHKMKSDGADDKSRT